MSHYRHRQLALIANLRDQVAQQEMTSLSLEPFHRQHRENPARGLGGIELLPQAFADTLMETAITPLQQRFPEHHYFQTDELHITVKNIRQAAQPPRFDDADVKRVELLLAGVIPLYSSFEVTWLDWLCLPTSLVLIGLPDTRHRDLVLALDVGLQDIGLPDDKGYLSRTVFLNNVSVCRFSAPIDQSFRDAVKMLPVPGVSLRVDDIWLLSANASLARASQTVHGHFKLQIPSQKADRG